MKVMVVGHAGRGKSSLLHALIKQRQHCKDGPTVGVVIRDWR